MEPIFYPYFRVSTADQSKPKTLKMHYFVLEQAFQEMGREWDPSLVRHDVFSGRKDNREGFQFILNEIRAGRSSGFAAVLDRMSRHAAFYHEIEELVIRYDARIWGVNQRKYLDFAGSTEDWAAFHTAGIAAEVESRKTANRVRNSIKFRQANKIPLGGPKLFGYTRNLGEGYQIDPSERDVARLAIKTFIQTRNCVAVIKALEKHGINLHPRSLRSWLASPVLRGHLAYNWRTDTPNTAEPIIYPNEHEALMSPEEWELIELAVNTPDVDLTGTTRASFP